MNIENDKFLSEQIKAFYREALLLSSEVMLLYLFVALGTVWMFAGEYISTNDRNIFIGAIICFFILIAVLHYYFSRVAILLYRDVRNQRIRVTEAKILNIRQEYTMATKNWTSNIGKLYPKELSVDRYIIQLQNSNGKKDFVRSIMSWKKHSVFCDLMLQSEENIKIYFFTKSRVAIRMEASSSAPQEIKVNCIRLNRMF